MSLIEEALRKQREETERVHTAAPSSPAPVTDTPPPLPADAQPAAPSEPPADSPDLPPERSTRTWRMLVGIGAIIVILIAALIWLMVVGVKIARTSPAVPPAAATAALPSSTPVTQAIGEIPPAANSPAPATADVTPVTPAVTPAVATAAAPVAAAAQSLPVPDNATAATGTVASVPEDKLKPVVIWPPISVSGIMGGGRTGRNTALVNGQMMGVGDSVESAKILTIEKRGVTFIYSGETRTLSVGSSTE